MRRAAAAVKGAFPAAALWQGSTQQCALLVTRTTDITREHVYRGAVFYNPDRRNRGGGNDLITNTAPPRSHTGATQPSAAAVGHSAREILHH